MKKPLAVARIVRERKSRELGTLRRLPGKLDAMVQNVALSVYRIERLYAQIGRDVGALSQRYWAIENRLHRATATHEEFIALREFIDERLPRKAARRRR